MLINKKKHSGNRNFAAVKIHMPVALLALLLVVSWPGFTDENIQQLSLSYQDLNEKGVSAYCDSRFRIFVGRTFAAAIISYETNRITLSAN